MSSTAAFDPLAHRTTPSSAAPSAETDDTEEAGAGETLPEPAADDKPQDAAAPAEPQQDDFTRRFEEITAADKASREAAKEAKAERERLAQERAALAKAREIEELLKSGKGPEALSKLGVDLNTVAEWHLRDGKPDPLKEVSSVKESTSQDIKTLREEIAQLKADLEVERWRGGLTQEISASPDDYEIVTLLGAEAEAESEAARYFEETGKLLRPNEAAARVRDRYEALVLKLKGSKRAQKLLGISVEKEPATTARAPKVIKEPKPAINEAASPDRLDDGPMDKHERIALIAAKFRR
jgi:hypothetical protein